MENNINGEGYEVIGFTPKGQAILRYIAYINAEFPTLFKDVFDTLWRIAGEYEEEFSQKNGRYTTIEECMNNLKEYTNKEISDRDMGRRR